jgi:hypothetical protein
MRTRQTVIGLLACAAIAAGCGDDDTTTTKSKNVANRVDKTARYAQLEKNPYDVRCGDLDGSHAAAEMSRVLQNALAADAKIRGLNQLQASQSIYFAITELCKAQPDSYRPAEDAIAAVRSGELRAEL